MNAVMFTCTDTHNLCKARENPPASIAATSDSI